MERLVRASLDAGRPVVLFAPYGEQSRVTLRSEAERVSRPDAAEAFRDANTVAWLLNKTRFSAEFREYHFVEADKLSRAFKLPFDFHSFGDYVLHLSQPNSEPEIRGLGRFLSQLPLLSSDCGISSSG
jgi:hypothetical protein